MTPEQIEAIVMTASGSFSAIFDFAFDPTILAVWGPPFILFLAVNLIRVALGKGYVPGSGDIERAGFEELRAELRALRERQKSEDM